MSKTWVRYQKGSQQGFGTLVNETIHCMSGDMYGESEATGETLLLNEVKLLAPCQPTKIVAMWNNFHQLAEAQNLIPPEFPFYFIKPESCVSHHGAEIIHPEGYDGRLIYEGELGVVIGKTCKNVSREQAADYVLGYTCINDVTAIHLLFKYEAFPQWTRAKSFDSFGVIGPCIVELDDPDSLIVKTLVNGEERQNYPVADMFFSPLELVSLISGDMTLQPGDVIACGTSLGVKTMKPNTTVEVVIDGVGTLTNTYKMDV
ncbi:MAG: 2-keto-4-pentenoate hydratase/2-oxohepta-3-ene-1,7-dioic acid hydratase in catechol pathway [Gammaproteobacteria bacterium]|jgi:2-keto-4-pentenoate hydratase/2-oxohepta-3-ene-1,7-dioic acid hydratase in catechol pathway